MLLGVERLVDLVGVRTSGLSGATSQEIVEAIRRGDTEFLANTGGHFAAAAREGQTVRLARTVGIPLRYFVAKMFHGPFLVVSDRIDSIYEWCCEQNIGWQFDPTYTRMIPAHHIVEIDQIGCPDPAPRYHRFFNPEIATGANDVNILGAEYVGAAKSALTTWIKQVPDHQPIGVAFSGGVDSLSTLLMARAILQEIGSDTTRLRAFTLDLGGGQDVKQAREAMQAIGMEDQWEAIRVPADELDLPDAIHTIEDYHPLDVECSAVAICLLRALRENYPALKYLIDGDGGDENLKSYPLEDSDLTLSSVLRNPMLYQEGWGVTAIKHSQTYSGGLSRSYIRTFAPAQRFGFEAFSPYSTREAMEAAIAIPFDTLLNGSVQRLYSLKAELVAAGVKQVLGVDMPTFPKRRFQDGADETYKRWKVSKSWCRQLFLKDWESRLKQAWEADNQLSGNVLPDGSMAG